MHEIGGARDGCASMSDARVGCTRLVVHELGARDGCTSTSDARVGCMRWVHELGARD